MLEVFQLGSLICLQKNLILKYMILARVGCDCLHHFLEKYKYEARQYFTFLTADT